MKRTDFLQNLNQALEQYNCPSMVTPGRVDEQMFKELGVRFSQSSFIMLLNNQIGYDDMLVCFDENDNVIAATVSNPQQFFLIALNISNVFYKAPIKSWKYSQFDSDKLIILLK